MGYLGHVLAGMIGLGLLAADVLILLLLVRLLRPHLRWRLVAAVDNVARPAVDAVLKGLAPAWRHRQVSEESQVRMCLLLLLIGRLAASILLCGGIAP